MDIYAVGLSTDGTDACLRVVFQMGIFKVTIMVNTHCMKVGLKYTVPGLPISENSIILGSLVLMHSQHVMDTPPAVKLCCSTAERDKN